MLEVEPIGYHGQMFSRSCQNSNEAVAGAASEAFARCLHHRYNPFKLSSLEDILICHKMILCYYGKHSIVGKMLVVAVACRAKVWGVSHMLTTILILASRPTITDHGGHRETVICPRSYRNRKALALF